MRPTGIIVTAGIIILGIYDLIVVSLGGVNQSVSRFLQDTAFKSPLVTFAFGFVAGHIFGYMHPKYVCTKCKELFDE